MPAICVHGVMLGYWSSFNFWLFYGKILVIIKLGKLWLHKVRMYLCLTVVIAATTRENLRLSLSNPSAQSVIRR
jgi:hypothetical protein